jgi:hypothetical protein
MQPPPSLAADSPQQRSLVLAVEKGSRRKCSRFLELIGFTRRGNTCRPHAIYEPNTSNMVIGRGIVKHGRGDERVSAGGFQGAAGAMPDDRGESFFVR